MNQIIPSFKTLFETRFNNYSILDLGEDSVRYDFFVALMQNKNLSPHEIQPEFPIDKRAYVARMTQNSRRMENPQIDLWCCRGQFVISAEFGLFKRNSNPNGSINATERQFKLLNDLLRLGLQKIYVPNDAYFICVADSKILGKKMRGNSLPAFPAQKYSFNNNDINNWTANSKTAKDVFDTRFMAQANLLGLQITADLIYNQKLLNPPANVLPHNQLETRVLVYRIVSCEVAVHNRQLPPAGNHTSA